MKIIQQEFTIKSPLCFILSLAATIFFTCAYFFVDYNSILMKIIGTLGLITIITSLYNTYCFSFIYDFKQEEIISSKLFGIFGSKTYKIKNLIKIEYTINNKGITDGINLYFIDKTKISLSMFQVDLGKVKLFLFAHVANFEEIEDKVYRRWS